MPKTISGRSDDGALEKVPGLPGDYPQLVNDRARGDRCGRRCGLTEEPRSGRIVPGAGAGSDEDSNPSGALRLVQSDHGCGHGSERVMAPGKLERLEKHPGVYRRHVKGCSRQGRCQCAYVLVYNGRTQTFRTPTEAKEGKLLARRQVKLSQAHAQGLHRGLPDAECPECARERVERESGERPFAEFATEWYAEHEHEWGERTRTDYCWRLKSHLLPWFGSRRASEIDVDRVDSYKAHKLGESERLRKKWAAWRDGRGEKPQARPLGPRTINMALILL